MKLLDKEDRSRIALDIIAELRRKTTARLNEILHHEKGFNFIEKEEEYEANHEAVMYDIKQKLEQGVF